MAVAAGLEETAITGIADQRLVAAAQLTFQCCQDRGTVGSVAFRLLTWVRGR